MFPIDFECLKIYHQFTFEHVSSNVQNVGEVIKRMEGEVFRRPFAYTNNLVSVPNKTHGGKMAWGPERVIIVYGGRVRTVSTAR